MHICEVDFEEKIEEKTVKLELTKMSKTIEENKLAVTVKNFLWEFNLYCKFMCTDKNNDQDKTNLLPLPFQFIYTVLNCWKTTKSMALKL